MLSPKYKDRATLNDNKLQADAHIPAPHNTAVQPAKLPWSWIWEIATAYLWSVQHSLSKHCMPASTYLQMISLSLPSGGKTSSAKHSCVFCIWASAQTGVCACACAELISMRRAMQNIDTQGGHNIWWCSWGISCLALSPAVCYIYQGVYISVFSESWWRDKWKRLWVSREWV